MPPKRKQAAKENGGSKSKNQKSEAAEEEQKQVEVEINATLTVDPFCTTKLGKARVFTEDGVDWEAMLLTPDNKHFYLLQLLEDSDCDPSMQSYFVWTRWGKVGGKSQSKLHDLVMLEAAKLSFERRFFEKTENDWDDKINFQPSGKYDLIKTNFNIGNPLLEVVVPKVSDDVEKTQLSNASKENGENKSKRQKKTKAAETITKRQPTKDEEEVDKVKATTIVSETRSKRQPTKVNDEEEVDEVKATTIVSETRSKRQPTKVNDEEEVDEVKTTTKIAGTRSKRQQTKVKVEEEVDELKTTAKVTETRSKRQQTKVKDEEEIDELKTTNKTTESRPKRQKTKLKEKEDEPTSTTGSGDNTPKKRQNTAKVAESPTNSQKANITDEEETVEPTSTTSGDAPKKRQTANKVAENSAKRLKTKFKEEEDAVELKTITTSGDKTPVDSFCTAKVGKAHVYIENDVIWDAMLNQTNIQFNNNKFYLIQLLEDTNCKSYSVWLRWGRVGKTGQSKLSSFGLLDAAKNCFKSKFFDKTKNDWDDKIDFVKHSGKYDLIHTDFNLSKALPEVDVSKVSVKIKDSQLDQRLQDLMKLICNIQTMEETVLEMKYDSKKAPLGKLTEEQVKAGYSALKEIEQLIENKSTQQRSFVESSNRFYTRIPHNFGMKTPPVINTIAQVLEKVQLLQVLSDIEVAMKILNMNLNGDILDNPIDRQYKCLHCDINAMEKTDEMYKTIENYLLKSHGKTHSTFKMKVLNIFNCEREGESDQFKNLDNRMLLWHGSRLTNVASILSQGLRIAPPEAPSSGYMFGKGVYFADRSSKSANYCFASRSSNVGILLLCEVALGNSNELKDAKYDADKLPKGCSSVKGLGTTIPDPTQAKILEDGTVIPFGKGVSDKDSSGRGLIYNEYIVYDTKQIKLKYVVQVQFNFK